MAERRTGWIYHESYLWHDTGRWQAHGPEHGRWLQAWEHYENPDTKRRFNNLLEVSGFSEELVRLKPEPATVEQVLRFHTPSYVERVRELSAAGGGDAGVGAAFSAGGFEIALLSAGGTIRAVDAVIDGEVDNAYALVRPPGHHAERDQGKGFCIFGNVAIAAMHALSERGLGKVATLDWDVHHGNGTQQAFYERKDVLTISIHQDDCFPPGSGTLAEQGEGEGVGYNINIPLPPGSGHGAYTDAVRQVVVPALRAYGPDLIIVPSGFDASNFDPLARMMAHSGTFREMTRLLLEAADELCSGRLVMSHEGGYSPIYVPFCGLAVMEELSGKKSIAGDPFAAHIAASSGQELQPHQQSALDDARALVDQLQVLEGK
jgi:acetoin utilization deacetylase AcuC-like enzyme